MTPLSADAILAVVSTLTGIDAAEICGSSKRNDIVQARGIFCVLAHDFRNMSYPEIAEFVSVERSTAVTTKAAVSGHAIPFAPDPIAHTTPLTSAQSMRRLLLAAEAKLTGEIARRDSLLTAGGVR